MEIQNDSPEITRVCVLLLYLYQKIDSELQEKTGPGGGENIKLVEVSFEIMSMFEDSVTSLNSRQTQQPIVHRPAPHIIKEQPQNGEEILKQLLGEDKLQQIKQQSALQGDLSQTFVSPFTQEKLDKKSPSKEENPVFKLDQKDNKSRQLQQALNNFTKYSKQYFKQKFQDEIAKQFNGNGAQLEESRGS